MDTFGNQDVLAHSQVHIPEHLAAQDPRATAITSIDTQDRVPEAVIHLLRVLVQARAKKCRSHVRKVNRRDRMVMSRTTPNTRTAHVDGVLEGRKAAAAPVRLPESLSASGLIGVEDQTVSWDNLDR